MRALPVKSQTARLAKLERSKFLFLYNKLGACGVWVDAGRATECDAKQAYYIDTVRAVEFYITECSIQVKFCIRHFKSLYWECILI